MRSRRGALSALFLCAVLTAPWPFAGTPVTWMAGFPPWLISSAFMTTALAVLAAWVAWHCWNELAGDEAPEEGDS